MKHLKPVTNAHLLKIVQLLNVRKEEAALHRELGHQGRQWAVDSTDRCNTLCELLSWGLILQGLSRSLVQLSCYGAEFCLGMNR